MGRIVTVDFDESKGPLRWGLFNATLLKVEDDTVILKDIFSRERISIDLTVDEKTLAYTNSSKKIWINQLGEVGYGEEEDLFDSFKKFRTVESWNTSSGKYEKGAKPEEYSDLGNKRYWHARVGEVHLFNFLKAYHNLPINSKETDYSRNQSRYNLRKLLSNDSGHEPTIGGCVYVTQEGEEKVIPKYVPGCYVSILKNFNGNFANQTHYNPSVKEFFSYFNSMINPIGYYSWENLSEWEMKRKVSIKNDSEF
jgi:hypothetical protein